MMPTPPDHLATRRGLLGLARRDDGVAAIEFALILPFMVLTFLGLSELSFGLSNDRKVTQLTRTIADLVGRTQTVTQADINNIFNAAKEVVAPFDSSRAKMRLSSVVIREKNGAYTAEVCWSKAKGLPPRGSKEPVAVVPEGFTPPTGSTIKVTSYIWAEVEMEYVPMFGSSIVSSLILKDETPWSVRNPDPAKAQVIFKETSSSPEVSC